jgi:hypothetical protein
MTERVPRLRNELAPEVFLRGQSIVRRAAQGQVRRDIGSASCERLQVVKLEVARTSEQSFDTLAHLTQFLHTTYRWRSDQSQFARPNSGSAETEPLDAAWRSH